LNNNGGRMQPSPRFGRPARVFCSPSHFAGESLFKTLQFHHRHQHSWLLFGNNLLESFFAYWYCVRVAVVTTSRPKQEHE
jgi:hypothetical protein